MHVTESIPNNFNDMDDMLAAAEQFIASELGQVPAEKLMSGAWDLADMIVDCYNEDNGTYFNIASY